MEVSVGRRLRSVFLSMPVVALAAMVSGCFTSRTPYPNAWPTLNKSVGKKCEGVEGTYSAKYSKSSDGVVSNSSELGLQMYLLKYGRKRAYDELPDPAIHLTEFVTIQIEGSKFSAILSDKQHTLLTLNLSDGPYKFSCNGTYIEFSHTYATGGLFMYGAETDRWQYHIAADKSLIVTHRTTARAAFIVVPMGGSESTWMAFDRTNDQR